MHIAYFRWEDREAPIQISLLEKFRLIHWLHGSDWLFPMDLSKCFHTIPPEEIKRSIFFGTLHDGQNQATCYIWLLPTLSVSFNNSTFNHSPPKCVDIVFGY
jgi:hypothetical protein